MSIKILEEYTKNKITEINSEINSNKQILEKRKSMGLIRRICAVSYHNELKKLIQVQQDTLSIYEDLLIRIMEIKDKDENSI